MRGFWHRWLVVWCACIVGFGIVTLGAASAATDGPIGDLLSLMSGAAPSFDPPLRFALGLTGAVTLGWGLTLLAIVQGVRAAPELAGRLWRPVLVGMVAWYVLDSGVSIATGFALNAASNSLLMAGLLLPLIRSGVLRGRPAPGTAIA